MASRTFVPNCLPLDEHWNWRIPVRVPVTLRPSDATQTPITKYRTVNIATKRNDIYVTRAERNQSGYFDKLWHFSDAISEISAISFYILRVGTVFFRHHQWNFCHFVLYPPTPSVKFLPFRSISSAWVQYFSDTISEISSISFYTLRHHQW